MSSERSDAESSGTSSAGGEGLSGSMRRLAAHGLEMLQLRLELFSTELEAAKLRIFGALAQLLLALLLAGAALLMLSLSLLLLSPPDWRWLVALGLMLVYGGLAWWIWGGARAQLSQPAGPFGGSAAELTRDQAAMEP